MNLDIINIQIKINQKTNVLYLLNVCERPTKLSHHFIKRTAIELPVAVFNFILSLK